MYPLSKWGFAPSVSEFDFEVEYIPGETNGFADALLRIYSDEKPGIVRAQSELVDNKDEMRTHQSRKVSPVYVEVHLLSLMSAEIRRSARLASKPTPQYKETKERRPTLGAEGQKPRGQIEIFF